MPELDSLPDLVLIVEASTQTILRVNKHGASELGWTPDDLIGHPLAEFGDQSERSNNDQLAAQLSAGEKVHFDRRVKDQQGNWRTFNFAARLVDGDSDRLLLVGREMDDLANSNSRLADLLKLADLTEDIFVVCDREGWITYANAATARVHRETTFVGRHLSEFVHPDDTGFMSLLSAIDAPDNRATARVMAKLPDGESTMFEVQTIYDVESERFFTVERDISRTIETEREMQSLAEGLRHQATTDSLTGVANRNALNETLEHAVDLGEPFALLLLDMDDFKSVNDTLGHGAGDEFLQCVAKRIEGAVDTTDLVARLGGDEFVVLLPGIDEEAAAATAARVIKAVGQEYSIAGISLMRSCSIGVAVWQVGDSVSDVLRKADRAAYRAKHEGRSRFAVY